jgi:LPS sulfotransferase NodH
MKVKVEIKNLINNKTFGPHEFANEDSMNEWIQSCEEKQKFGKPERWMQMSDMCELEKQRTKHSRTNADVIEEWLVKRDYDILVQPVSDYAEQRRSEYPSMNDVIEALVENMEGRPQKLNQIKEKRAYVRKKYPKLADGEIERR